MSDQKKRSIPVVTMVVTVGDETVTRTSNGRTWFIADKALVGSGRDALNDLGSYTGLAATAYALTAGVEQSWLRQHDGSHVKAFEAWLALDPDFKPVKDGAADPTEAAELEPQE